MKTAFNYLVLGLASLGIIYLLTGCVSLAHVDPKPRDPIDRGRAAVKVLVKCDSMAVIYEGHSGTGVVISERHVLTAAHVVKCPVIPRVWVITIDGDRHKAVVVRENETQDIAKLEIFHAGRFGLDIAPPILAGPWDSSRPLWTEDYLCAYLSDEPSVCGIRTDPDVFQARMEHGDSGAGVYDREYLVGLVIRDIPHREATRVTIVTPDWLVH